MRILLIRFSSLGDILLTTPCVSLVKEHYPDSEIFFATKSQFSSLLSEHPDIDRVFSLREEDTIRSFAKKIRKHGPFDWVLDLHNSLRSRIVRTLIRKKNLCIYRKVYWKRWLLVHFKINLLPPHEPMTFRYMKALEPMGILPRKRPPYIALETSPNTEKMRVLSENKTMLAIAPGARWYTKTWPLDNFLKVSRTLINALGGNFVLVFVGGPEEKELGRKVEQTFQEYMDRNVFNLIGRLSIRETSMVLSYARLLLCNDSGLMHAAHGLNIPVLPLFLSTVPEFGFVPWGLGPDDIISPPLDCKPCDHKGLSRCPKKHFRCAELIQPEEVNSRVLKMLKK